MKLRRREKTNKNPHEVNVTILCKKPKRRKTKKINTFGAAQNEVEELTKCE